MMELHAAGSASLTLAATPLPQITKERRNILVRYDFIHTRAKISSYLVYLHILN